MLDSVLQDRNVTDRLLLRFQTPPDMAMTLVVLGKRRFLGADYAVFEALAPHLSFLAWDCAKRHLDRTLLAGLSQRERSVVAMIAQGLSNADAATALDMSVHTVKHHVTTAMRVTGCTNRTQLALLWHRSSGTFSDAGRSFPGTAEWTVAGSRS
nr:helix-turn-helix transcriptional regulator [Micromonospora sp. DSM 115978]